MDEKIITCVDSCHFCARQGYCPHFGEEGYHCTRFKDLRPDEEEHIHDGDAEPGISYASEQY